MKYISVLLFCASIFDKSYSCPRHILKSKEFEIDKLEDYSRTHSSDDYHINKLRDEIKLLKTECQDFNGISLECWEASYICTSTRYLPGCPCWMYEMEYENVTTAKLKFNTFYPNGLNLVKDDERARRQDKILNICDLVSPPWPSYYIYDENSGLTEFTHCIQNWKIDCFCSSAQRSSHPKKILESVKKSDKTVSGPYKDHLELCRQEMKYNCSDVKDKNVECSCWDYNVTYAEQDLFKINVVICLHPYLNCYDENRIQGCPCWKYEVLEANDEGITYSGQINIRFGANKNEEENILDLDYQRTCRQKNLRDVFPDLGAQADEIATFTHCYKNDVVWCYTNCTDPKTDAPFEEKALFETVSCSDELIEVGGSCVEEVSDS